MFIVWVVRLRNWGFFESPSLRVGSQNDRKTGLPKIRQIFGIKRVVIVRVACANKLIFALQLTITCERRHPECCFLDGLAKGPPSQRRITHITTTLLNLKQPLRKSPQNFFVRRTNKNFA